MHSTLCVYPETPKICSSAAWNQGKSFSYFVLRDVRVCLLLSFCNSNLIQHNSLSFKWSVALCHPDPLCERVPRGPSELGHGRSPSLEGPREAEPVSHCSSRSLAAFLLSAGLYVKEVVSPLDFFSEEFAFVRTSSLIPGSLEKGMLSHFIAE